MHASRALRISCSSSAYSRSRRKILDLPRMMLVLPAMFLLMCWTGYVAAFNLSPRPNIVFHAPHSGPRSSYFGYTVSMVKDR